MGILKEDKEQIFPVAGNIYPAMEIDEDSLCKSFPILYNFIP